MSVHGLTAGELIAILRDLDADTEVFVRGYEDGVNSVVGGRPIRVNKFAHGQWYYGQHDEVSFDSDRQDSDVIGVEIVGEHLDTSDE
ncbi:hypothetical protein ICV35_24825 [Rhodococcus ruber]|uniref:hypothetical protein n=1 Tax=Rhodococcus ruber TaxID=1830 RepID=UPI001786187E|nr:hypothetical protein [Rhodococcus ruber]MBD8056874.1 hypothetical protein [Rhodococcus ruber]